MPPYTRQHYLPAVYLQQFSADAYPHLLEFVTEHILKPGYDFGNEFEFGLSMILDALARSIPAKTANSLNGNL